MAKYGSADVAFLLVDGYSILGVQTEFSDEFEALTEESHGLGSGRKEHSSLGVQHGTFEQSGFFDDAAGSGNTALVSQHGTARILCYGVETDAVGKKFTGFEGAMQINYQRQMALETLHKATAQYKSSGEFEFGRILADQVQRTTAGDTESTPVDNGGSSASGGAAYLQVSALDLDGYDNLIVRVRHSADDISYATKASFTAVTAAPGAERIELSGTINWYVAVSWEYTGSGTSPSQTFMVGLVRN